MTTVPALTPVTAPPALIVAMVISELLHVPPEGVPVSGVEVLPTQTEAGPVMVGRLLTVTGKVPKQPVGNVYVMITLPPLTPVTTPLLLTVALEVLELLHVPPGTDAKSAMVEPTQTVGGPVTTGLGFTVTVVVVVRPQGSV